MNIITFYHALPVDIIDIIVLSVWKWYILLSAIFHFSKQLMLVLKLHELI